MASVQASAWGPKKAYAKYCHQVHAPSPRPGSGAYLLYLNTFRFFFHCYLIFITLVLRYSLFSILRVNHCNKK